MQCRVAAASFVPSAALTASQDSHILSLCPLETDLIACAGLSLTFPVRRLHSMTYRSHRPHEFLHPQLNQVCLAGWATCGTYRASLGRSPQMISANYLPICPPLF